MLQNTFYVMGIIFMLVATIVTIGIGVAIYAIYKKVEEIEREVQSKVDALTNLSALPAKIIMGAGSYIANMISRKRQRIRVLKADN